MSEREWTVMELAEAGGVSDSRIRQLLMEGRLSGRKRAGAWFIPDDIAQVWLTERREKAAQKPKSEEV